MSATKDMAQVLASLESIEVRVRDIANIVAQGGSCEDILARIGEVKTALHQTGQAVLEKRFYQCASECIAHAGSEDSRQKLAGTIREFVRMV